jgi:hypothetical protein
MTNSENPNSSSGTSSNSTLEEKAQDGEKKRIFPIDELERKIILKELPKSIESVIYGHDKNREYMYVARVFDLRLYNPNSDGRFQILGNSELTKYEETYVEKRKRWFSRETNLVKKYKKIWKIKDVNSHICYFKRIINLEEAGYKKYLLNQAYHKKIPVQNKLIEEAFKEIDDKLMALYQ